MVKIFITGCAKSGTTLLKRLFNSFESTWVVVEETPLKNFAAVKKIQVGEFNYCVAKRNYDTIFSRALPKQDIQNQLTLIKRHNIKIINIVRDGRNVVKSYNDSWGIYNPFEWMECVRQAQAYKEHIDYSVRYEDLLAEPDKIQDEIIERFGFKKQFLFSDYPNFVVGEDSDKVGYTLRKLDNSKIVPDRLCYLERPNDIEHFNYLLESLNYTV